LFVNGDKNIETDSKIKISLEKTIKKITEDIEKFKFNTAVSSLMIFINGTDITGNSFDKNSLTGTTIISNGDLKRFLQILAPFAPHMTEELWQKLGEKESIHKSEWPTYDESKIKDEKIKIAVQVNGKVRGEIEITPDASEEQVKEIALSEKSVKDFIKDSEIKKFIYIPSKIVNVVI